jgi:cellulose synthase/poly-beta-1,6-N-acetylglucosamine synthase-like glycosyltransferase
MTIEVYEHFLVTVALGIASAYLLIITIYMFAVTVGSWLYRGPRRRAARGSRIAIVIPAHNEGRNLLRTLDDLRRCSYPTDLSTTIVIADNCNDDTAKLAREHGAMVFERHDLAARGKGQALDWLLRNQRQLLSEFRIVVVVDADMYVDAAFLDEIDWSFSGADVQVVQSRDTIANPSDSLFSAFGFLSFAYVNHIRPAGRCFLGGTAGLKGSGMAFRSELILETGWPASSIAEDTEFSKYLLLQGIRIHYAPLAILTSDIGGRLHQVETQQLRWEGGKSQVSRRFLPRILRQFATKPSVMLLDALLNELIPPLSMLVVLSVTGFIAAYFSEPWLAFPFGAALLVFGAAVVSGAIQLRMPAGAWLLLTGFPLFLLFKFYVFGKLALQRRAPDWNRTPRSDEPPENR